MNSISVENFAAAYVSLSGTGRQMKVFEDHLAVAGDMEGVQEGFV